MLVLNSIFDGLDIISIQAELVIGSLEQPIIDPRDLKVVAFYCSGPNLDKNSVLHASDIIEYQMDGIFTNSVDNIMPLSVELVRLQDVIALDFTLINKSVIDNYGQKLGKVESYAINTENFDIVQLRIAQSVFKGINKVAPLIYRQQIIEVTDNYIVVKAPDVSSTVKNKSLKQIFSSPKQTTASGGLKSNTDQ